MKNNFGWITFFILRISAEVSAQSPPEREVDPQRWIEEAFPAQSLDLNYSDLYENLLQRISHPLDLNKASIEELRSLLVLREFQLTALVQYRESNGPFLSVYELQSIPAIDMQTIQRLAPLVRVDNRSNFVTGNLSQQFKEGQGYVVLRDERTLQQKKGYKPDTAPDQRYAGSPNKQYARFRFSRPGDFSFGLTGEKDAGEPWRWKPSQKYYGADFISAHCQIMNKGRLKNLVVGDFQAQFGQGLMLGGGFGIGKGSETITTIRKSNVGFMPYMSLNESGYFRGGAISYGLTKRWTLHAMASVLQRDAHAGQDTTDTSALVSSFVLSGYHRTPLELATRKIIRETNVAAIWQYKHRAIDAGLIIHGTDFNLPLIRTPTLYNQFAFKGLNNLNTGGYVNSTLGSFTLFGEAAKTLGKGSAVVVGILGSITRELDISVLYRNYSRNFISFYGNALSENTSPQNEEGFYTGMKFSPSKKFTASGYVDMFRFPWLRYRDYAPSNGSEWLLRMQFQPSPATLVFIQVREEIKARNNSSGTNLYQTFDGTKRNYWIHAEYKFLNRLIFRSRIQFSTYAMNHHPSQGIAVMQDVSLRKGRFEFSWRYALFDTDDYDNRLYAYERDVWLALSFPAYYGKGIRNVVQAECRLNRNTTVWVRWAHTRFTDRDVIGTGSETIQGNTQDDIKLQLRVSF